MNINSSPIDVSPKLENPPPIPPKAAINSSFNASFEQVGSLDRRRGDASSFEAPSPENYSVPKMKSAENGEGSQNDTGSPC